MIGDAGPVDLARRIASLSPEKRVLLERHLRRRAVAGARQPGIPRRDSSVPAPLSYAQQRLWFLSQVERQDPVYTQALRWRLTGPLNVEAVRRAFDSLVERHESLRTVFCVQQGEPVQIVTTGRPASFTLVDLRSEPASERAAEAQRLIANEVQRPFDLEHGPLIRMTLLRLADDDHTLMLTLHHIVSDRWSLGVILQELTELYRAFDARRAPSLPPLPVQYPDFAAWQRARLQGDDMDRLLAYWRDQLVGAPLVLDLPTDRPRPRTQSFRGAGLRTSLTPELTRQLREVGQQDGATLFMTLLAAFATLLYRYTGLDDFVVGSPVAGRNHRELEGVVGCFINTVALRANLRGNPTFHDLLGRLRETTLGAYAHQDMPFEKLVDALQPRRDPARPPIVQVAFTLENKPPGGALRESSPSDIRFRQVDVDTATAKFDLTLFVTEVGDGLSCWFEYNTDLFDRTTIRRLARQYQTLLEGIVADPDRQISELPLLTEPERRQLLDDWNTTARAYPSGRCVHELFDEQAARTPDAVAFVCGDQQLTYGELRTRANRLAHALIRRGVGPDVLVGVRLERSLDLVVGLLAVLKAGGAYLPLDLEYPPERQAFMLADAQVAVLLTRRALSTEEADGVPVLCLDAEADAISRESDASPNNRATAEHLAYVIYTSGSTGQPKGVAVPHRAINRLVVNADYVQLGPSDVVAQASSASFDAATFEIWGALLNGARLVLVSKDVLLTPQALAVSIERHQIGTMFVTTALFNQLAAEVPAIFRGCKQILFGGEAVDPRSVRQVLRAGPPRRLLHVYGPTETTTFAAWHLVTSVPDDATTIPIGRPIANTQLYVLDRERRPQPIGVPGELYIGGPGVARGYLNRPAMTEQQFVPDRLSGQDGARLYRTGDLVRLRADSSIEFIGRIDGQVKIRGFRIELGEIEAILRAHPGVRQSMVIAHDSGQAGKRPVAYVVPGPDGVPPADELRRFLRRKLPEYMVPVAFVPIEAVPLTANGKVDRAALPAPETALPGTSADLVTPRTAVEARLAELWVELLDVPSVGVTDDFFELGGHSLLVVRLIAEIERTFSKKLPVATFFQNATIEALAALIGDDDVSAFSSSLVPIQAGGSRSPLFCVHPLGGDVLCYHGLARQLGPDQPLYGLQARGLDGMQAPLDDVREMAALYIQQARSVQPVGPYHLFGFSSGGTIVYEMAQQLREAGDEVALLAILDHPVTTSGYYRPLIRPEHWPTLLYDLSAYVDKLTRPRLDQAWHRLRACWSRLQEAIDRSTRPSGRPERTVLDTVVDYVARNIAGDASLLALHHRKVIEAQYVALTGYKPQPYPGRVHLLRARRQPILCSHDPEMGWGKLARGGVIICTVPGSHLGVLREPNTAVLAQQLADLLAGTAVERLRTLDHADAIAKG